MRPYHLAAPSDVGFVLIVAHDTWMRLLGFTNGRVGRHLAARAGHSSAWNLLPFELRELDVTPQARGHDIGAALHGTLAAATPMVEPPTSDC